MKCREIKSIEIYLIVDIIFFLWSKIVNKYISGVCNV